MEIRLLTENDIKDAKALWKSAFSDSDEFIDTYFGNKISSGNSVGIFDGGLASVVHMIPLRIRVQGKSFDTAFIAGAATAEHQRKQGLMKDLLLKSLELMRERDIAITFLYPFLHSFYEQYGWATYSYTDKRQAVCGKKAERTVETKDTSLLDAMYRNMTKNMDGCVIRGQKEWKWRLDELFADGGKILVLYEQHEPVCYMMYYEQDDGAEAIEAVYDKPMFAKRLAEHLSAEYGKVSYNLVSQQSSSAHGMARIVDAEKLLSELGFEHLLQCVSIKDGFARWNNMGSGALSIDIVQLAKLILMGAERAYEGGTVPPEILDTDLKTCFTCIFEEY